MLKLFGYHMLETVQYLQSPKTSIVEDNYWTDNINKTLLLSLV